MECDVIVLAGGKGTRLKEVSGDIPKPLVPVEDNAVFLDYILAWLASAGVQRVILSLCYCSESFKAYLCRRSWPFKVDLLVEPEPLGTGGAIKYILEAIPISVHFGVVNGDTFLDFDLSSMERAALENPLPGMIGLSYVENTDRYGKVSVENGRVTAFLEKNQGEPPGWINNGCYFFDRRIFATSQKKFSLERDLFPSLTRKELLAAFETQGAFIDIGIPEDFHRFLAMENRRLSTLNREIEGKK